MIIGLMLIFVMSACDSNEDVAKDFEPDRFVTIMDVNVKLKDNTLSFNNKGELESLLNKIEDKDYISTRQIEKNANSYIIENKNWKIDEFQSLYDVFVEAMYNAESYYDKEGGYQKFKEKYSSLFFPEYEDDFSAYLPVSNPLLARFLNKNGEVIIAEKIVDMKDITTYEQLKELNLTPPDELVISG